jgi:DNA-binding helix-hairpin-helix protein with protein kinase domain
LCLTLFDQRGREAQKTMWGIVGLVPRFPARIVEQAVEAALAYEHRSAKAIRAIAEPLLQKALAEMEEQNSVRFRPANARPRASPCGRSRSARHLGASDTSCNCEPAGWTPVVAKL